MMQTPLTVAMVGVACILAPILITILAPLILLLTPLLLPVGLGLTFFGLGRAGLIATLGGAAPQQQQIPYRRNNRFSRDWPVEDTDEPEVIPTRQSRRSRENGAKTPPLVLKEGSFKELNQLAGKRANQLAKQVGQLVRNNLSKATREVSGEVEQHLHALQRELQSWAGANPNLKPYCHGHIGWLLRLEARQLEARRASTAGGRGSPENGASPLVDLSTASSEPELRRLAEIGGSTGDLLNTPLKLSRSRSASPPTPTTTKVGVRQRADLDLSLVFEDLLEVLPPSNVTLTPDSLAAVPLPSEHAWEELGFLLVPGLLTKWYPLYMKQLRADMKRLGLHVAFSRVDTDQPVRINAARLRHEILEMSANGTKVMLLGHSKGAVDCAAALSLFPELCDVVAGLVSLQGPHGGSAIAHDLGNTNVQKTVLLGALEKLLRGCKHAVLDLSFESRQEFLRQHAYPAHKVPTLCVASCDRRQSSLLTPLIEYVAVRYGEVCDGLVCQCDAILPNCVRIVIDDVSRQPFSFTLLSTLSHAPLPSPLPSTHRWIISGRHGAPSPRPTVTTRRAYGSRASPSASDSAMYPARRRPYMRMMRWGIPPQRCRH